MKFGMGQAVPRVEDPRLLRGGGRYTDDINLAGQARAYILRSPMAHARIESIDISAAKAAPGVLAVLTGADWAARWSWRLALPGLLPAAAGAAGRHADVRPRATGPVG